MFFQPENLGNFIIVSGHYGCGKTNLSLNLARSLSKKGGVTLVDLDIVNPYFRSSDYPEWVKQLGIHLVAPQFAHSNLDIPSLPAEVQSVFEREEGTVIVDVGGDDAGATALGRFAPILQKRQGGYQMLYIINQYRPQTKTSEDAAQLLKEIEAASRLKATGIINNSHLQGLTRLTDVLSSLPFAEKTAGLLGLPLLATTLPSPLQSELPQEDIPGILYPVEVVVTAPWQ